MPYYRAYIVGDDGHFVTFEAVIAGNDEEALEIARKFADGCNVELWQLDRKVGILFGREEN